MPRNEMLHPRRIQECFQCCPSIVGEYAMMNLDSIPKILNHLLMLMLVCNMFLFFSSWSISFLPTIGFNTILIAFMLCCQNVIVWLIVNNNRISALSFLSPTEFMVGVALGITIGGAILAFVLTGAFRHVAKCDDTTIDQVYEHICGSKKGSMNAVWFWSGVVFWLELCCSMLLAIGRPELTAQDQYESLGMTMDDYESHFRNARGQGIPGDMPAPTPHFVGDYANIPEIRSEEGSHTSSTMVNQRHNEYKVPDERARINHV